MKHRKRQHSSPGMFTVEMAIVFPIVLFTLLGLIYMSIVLYQNIAAETAAMRTANKVSYCWKFLGQENAFTFDDTDDTTQVLKPDYTQHDPYGGLVAAGESTRENNGMAYFNWIMGKSPQLMAQETTDGMAVEYNYALLWSSVTVKTNKHYINPFGTALTGIGIGERQDTEVKATVMVNDPTEFVRLAGLVYDTIKER